MKFQWNFNKNSYIFIQENAFENVFHEKTAILSQIQGIKHKQQTQIKLLSLISEWLSKTLQRLSKIF